MKAMQGTLHDAGAGSARGRVLHLMPSVHHLNQAKQCPAETRDPSIWVPATQTRARINKHCDEQPGRGRDEREGMNGKGQKEDEARGKQQGCVKQLIKETYRARAATRCGSGRDCSSRRFFVVRMNGVDAVHVCWSLAQSTNDYYAMWHRD